MISHPKSVKYLYGPEDGWAITNQSNVSTPYITHDCDDDEENMWYTKCIVPQAPIGLLGYTEYIKQMKCQFCAKRPPDHLITIWTLLNWDKLSSKQYHAGT